MKFVSVEYRKQERVGVLRGEDVCLLSERYNDVRDVIEAGESVLAGVQRLLEAGNGEWAALKDLKLLAPIRRFNRDILCTGWNYLDHFAEGQAKRGEPTKEMPKAPTFFTRGPDTVIGPQDPIAFDARLSEQWDYEAELAVVIGKTGRSIPEYEADNHIFGYCLANDVSQRDLQKRHGGQWLKGKSIDGTMPIGPCIVTKDEIDVADVRLECELNGTLLQSATISQMAFPIKKLIAELSLGMTLRAGDIVLTGTPSGVGFARTPPIFLADGDEVVVKGSGIGELRNRLVRTDLFGKSDIVIE